MTEKNAIQDGIREIMTIYASARKKIVKELTSIGISPYKDSEAIKVAKRVREILSALNSATNDWAEKVVMKVYSDERKRLRVSFDVLGLTANASEKSSLNKAMEKTFSGIVADFARARLTIKRSVDLYLHLVRKSAKLPMKLQEFDEEDVGELSGMFAELTKDAEIAGWSRKRLSDLIEQKLLASIESGNVITINGRNYQIDSYAEMVARTRLREAQSDATKSMCGAYDCDLVEFSSHNNPCDDCRELEGEVFSISGESEEYDELTDDVTPPIHPNCEHSISPTTQIAIDVNKEYNEAYEETG